MSKHKRTGICLIGNSLNALSLAYYLEKHNLVKKCFLFLKQNRDIIKSINYNSHVIENGFLYSFNLNSNSIFLGSLIKELNLEDSILEINKYSNNICYINENGKKYKIGKYICQIIFSLFKDYCVNNQLNVDKNENLQTFLLKCFNKKICENVIIPYCYHYFCCPPNNILINSYFPQLKNVVQDRKTLIKHFLFGKRVSFFSQNNKVFSLKGGNVSLTKKLLEHIQMNSEFIIVNNKKQMIIKSEARKLKIYSGRKKVKHEKIVFCLDPFELKQFLKKTKIEHKKKKILIKYLSTFQSFKIKITNVCFKKNVLPFQYSLESLLLVKENEKNKIISILFDSNIFPPYQKKINSEENNYIKENIFETSLRFLSKEQQTQKALQEINDFLKNILKIKDQPDLVVSNDFDVFPFNEKKDKTFRKIMTKNFKNVRIFWPFSFFKNMEFCLTEAQKFYYTNL